MLGIRFLRFPPMKKIMFKIMLAIILLLCLSGCSIRSTIEDNFSPSDQSELNYDDRNESRLYLLTIEW